MNSFAFFCFCLALCVVNNVSADGGSIKVHNGGGYVATFTVTYTLNGQQSSETSGDFTLGESKEIAIPDGASDIYLKVQEYWFPGSFTIIFNKDYTSPEQHCFSITGTTLNPNWLEKAC